MWLYFEKITIRNWDYMIIWLKFTRSTQPTQCLQKIFRVSYKVRAVPTFWEYYEQVFHNTSWFDCNLHVQHCSTQTLKQSGISTINFGLHKFRVMGKNKAIRGQMVCKDSLVVIGMINIHSENVKKTFHKNIPRTFPPNILWIFLCQLG